MIYRQIPFMRPNNSRLTGAREVHARIDNGGLGGKIVLLPWGTFGQFAI
jgi:hypothetical protein